MSSRPSDHRQMACFFLGIRRRVVILFYTMKLPECLSLICTYTSLLVPTKKAGRLAVVPGQCRRVAKAMLNTHLQCACHVLGRQGPVACKALSWVPSPPLRVDLHYYAGHSIRPRPVDIFFDSLMGILIVRLLSIMCLMVIKLYFSVFLSYI